MARPCPRCMGVLVRAGVRKVVYTTNLERFKIEKISSANPLT